MIYKKFQDLTLSALGLGAMRLPTTGSGDGPVDEAETARMVAYAMEHGINYFDTAYGYHNGASERVLGRILAQYPRESYYLADKFPGYDLANMDKVEEIFEEQLRRCGVDYFDFYLFHNVYERNVGPYLDGRYGILDYLLEQKRKGRIRHLGFSAHGSCAVMRQFLEACGQYMEFGQIQLNYLDWSFQEAEAKTALLREYHIPVWVMEPLRGGRLASLTPEREARLKALRPDETIPAWAFQPGAAPGERGDLRGGKAPGRRGAARPSGGGRGDGQGKGAPLHRLPLLHRPLSPGAGHPGAFGPVQRAYLYRGRLPRAHGGGGDARGQAPRGLHRVPELRGGLPAADQNLRGDGRLCGKTRLRRGVAFCAGLGYHIHTNWNIPKEALIADARWIYQGGRGHAGDPGGRLPV